MAQEIIIEKCVLEKLINENFNKGEMAKYLKVGKQIISRLCKRYNLEILPRTRVVSDEAKSNISKGRRKWCAENPDKHPWRNKDKFQSVPCQKVKEFIISKNIKFIEEFQPKISGRHFSIDIAMPDKLIALEINGNQHYEKDGSLKPYYQERHDLLETNGWNVYEIHYSACFNLEKLEEFFIKLGSAENKIEFDYFNYKPKEKKESFCELCLIKIKRGAKLCRGCFSKNKKNKNLTRIPRQEIESLPCICGNPKHKISKVCKQCFSSRGEANNLCRCGKPKQSDAKICKDCAGIERRKIVWPAPADLQKLLWEKSTVQIAKELGISDKAIEKFCKKNGLTKPPRGYWVKRHVPPLRI